MSAVTTYSWRRVRRSLRRIDLRNPLTDHPLNYGRVAWWLALPGRMGGSVWWDLSRGLPGALTGFASGFGWNSLSYPGGAGSIKCNGTSSYVVSTPPAALSITGPMTLLMTLNPISVSGGLVRLIKHDDSGDNVAAYGLDLSRSVAGKLSVIWNSTVILDPSNTALVAGNWYKVGFVRTGSAASWSVTVYRNGVADGTASTATNPVVGTSPLIGIGATPYLPSGFFSQ